MEFGYTSDLDLDGVIGLEQYGRGAGGKIFTLGLFQGDVIVMVITIWFFKYMVQGQPYGLRSSMCSRSNADTTSNILLFTLLGCFTALVGG